MADSSESEDELRLPHPADSDVEFDRDDVEYECVPASFPIGYIPIPGLPPAAVDRIIISNTEKPAFTGHPWTLGQLMQDLMRVGVAGNIANSAQSEYFKVFQRHLPRDNTVPSFDKAVKLVRARSQQKLREYPACHNDCTVLCRTCDSFSKAELEALKCSVCDQKFVNEKGQLKVR